MAFINTLERDAPKAAPLNFTYPATASPGTRHFTCRLVRKALGLPSAPRVSAAIM
jgi:hypothetical protein